MTTSARPDPAAETDRSLGQSDRAVSSGFRTGDDLADAAVATVERWLSDSSGAADRSERVLAERLSDLIEDRQSVDFTMRFVDRVARPEHDGPAAHQLTTLAEDDRLPEFLSPIDKALLWLGARLAPKLPHVVIPIARRRMRDLVGHLVVDADPKVLERHLASRREAGYAMNVNLLGEAILGEGEARRRFERTLALVRRHDVDYVSVKISAIASQIDLWAYDRSLGRIKARLEKLYDAAAAADPPTFINLDMEEYKDLDLTIDAFMQVLDGRPGIDGGIVLQTYLPDTFDVLQRLTAWANDRHDRGGGSIKIRLVKGANLAMEHVEAEIHGWPSAPYATKLETDANYKRCVDWVLNSERLRGVRIGIGSHNLFDVAWTHLLSLERGVGDRVEFEMLQGMAPSQAEVVYEDTGTMLLYTPVVARADFEVAIGYLFRRLEENASSDNFLRHLFSLRPGSAVFAQQEEAFRTSLARRNSVGSTPRRTQDRTRPPVPLPIDAPFRNEPDTDPVLPTNRAWAASVIEHVDDTPHTPMTETVQTIDTVMGIAGRAAATWAGLSAPERRRILRAGAERLAARRGDLISAMVHEASKTIAQADPEVSEAIDFARYYADRALDTEAREGTTFTPLGVVVVVPPWNFPVAIPAGGVLAALAAGNAVIFKPAPETPRCAEIVAEALWEAGVPRDVLQYVRTPDNEVGRHLITHANVGGVILTGSWDTANLFKSWKPDLRLFAETSGKNSLIVTPHADLDLAAADLVKSAFGHSGQKCSAASLGILVGDVFTSERFRRQIVDATESMSLGPTGRSETVMGPVIRQPEGPLHKVLNDDSFRWLLRPRLLSEDGRLWSPGIIDDVAQGSWYHRTECFGPVLGLMAARDLDHAIELQNEVAFGLTGGIHTLDPHEADRWVEAVQVGNAYINRHITGAIVRRQPFGGWKRSVVGPGAKAGGPNYVTQLGVWAPLGDEDDDGAILPTRQHSPGHDVREHLDRVGDLFERTVVTWLESAAASDAYWWHHEFSTPRDESGLRVESNVFRYRLRPGTVIRADAGASASHVIRAALAAVRTGAGIGISSEAPIPDVTAAGFDVEVEPDVALLARMEPWSRIRYVGTPSAELRAAAWDAEVDLIDAPVLAHGRRELLWYLREQAISRTLHRFGNLVAT